ncbi:hypothetical protein LOTGIDRAFT_201172 [Lottia gigantea]|uniref:Glutaredoxin-related protein 5, mitochondrial n=1 Tax=Lottia gigantea TaxID=225164 RepID=V4AQZ7_LOTGI|nr:hypothetical protein LOTGIDRAFT_201172 [Lottia gigantea]ESO99672.1 hypothetical protein LOTGIDRAFT_201172 [Lottia gigantea]
MNRLLKISTTKSTASFCRILAARYSTNTGSKEHIDGLVKDKKLVVFMKGTPDSPNCGFSNLVVQILRMHGVKDFQAHNVLADQSLRQGIKDYSQWQTIPQIYMNGEFIGGSDIMLEMHKNGDLIEELKKVGIRSALLDQQEDENKQG